MQFLQGSCSETGVSRQFYYKKYADGFQSYKTGGCAKQVCINGGTSKPDAAPFFTKYLTVLKKKW
jgi:hypothetical protein